jgi:hypothetical protein
MTRNEHIVIRRATVADDFELATLAVLDGGSEQPEGEILVAEAAGRLRAAVGSNGAAISDPFWPSADLVSMLRVHAGIANGTPRGALRLGLRRPALAA